ncbi:MAG TPA: ATP-binding protein [Candidatus Polarisedimenticolia bacterium]|nr:ATP-binding protein [Candidatus Polarisedimenticolia bacterium]
MQDTAIRELKELFARALREYLADGGEAALQQAYELGRRAIGDGVGVLDLVALHQEALNAVLRESRAPESCLSAVDASERFLAESLSTFEMTHLGFQEAVAALRRLNEKLEEEARRIAHALHDDAGQLLASVHLVLEEVSAGLPARTRDRLRRVRGPLDEIEKHLRRLSHELRPTILDDLGLLPAVEFLAQGVAARAGIEIQVEGTARPRLPSGIETALYRVVQEALRNATKHAFATRVDIRFEIGPEAARCMVKDDGRGFDLQAVLDRKGERGLGLIGMRERLSAVGGQFTIDSAPGRGTDLRIIIPLEGRDGHTGASGR